jgi:hypothetical protein
MPAPLRNGLTYTNPIDRTRRTRLPNWRYSQVVMADAPTAYWRLDETAGTAAADRVGANTGTYSGGFTLAQPGALAELSGAALFNGTTGLVSATTVASGATNFTMELWIKPTALPQQGGILTNGDLAANGYGFFVGNNTGFSGTGTRLLYLIGGVAWIDSAADLVAGAWHHIVVTRDTADSNIYVNGYTSRASFANTPVAPSGGVLTIGRDGTTFYFGGTIDEVAIYSSCLPASRILMHYRAGRRLDY